MTERKSNGFKRAAFEKEKIEDCIVNLVSKAESKGTTTREILDYIEKHSNSRLSILAVRRYVRSLVKAGKIISLKKDREQILVMIEWFPLLLSKQVVRPAPERGKGRTDVLLLHIKGVYFDQIKFGKKTEEYREIKPFNTSRLSNPNLKTIKLVCGYPKKGSDSKYLQFPWSGYSKRVINHEEFGPAPIEVYVIPLRRW